MERPKYNPFHYRAIYFLREKMAVSTRALPTDAVADAHEPTRARLAGHVLPPDHASVLGYLALMLLLCAGILAMASARAGIDPVLVQGLRVSALGTAIVALFLIALDNWQEHRARRLLDVVVLARAGDGGEVDVGTLERLLADANGQLWVMSEAGFTSDALALARARGVRCFGVRKQWIEEVVAGPAERASVVIDTAGRVSAPA